MSHAPFITKRYGANGGEYSTVELPNGVIETCWFPTVPNGRSSVIGRVYPQTLAAIAEKHIAAFENDGAL